MKNQPTSIFLDLGFESDNTGKEDFNELSQVTWSVDNATGNGLEYVSLDEMLSFMQYVLIRKNGDEISPSYSKELYKQFKNRVK